MSEHADDLSPDDRAILARDGCLVDVEEAARVGYDATNAPISGDEAWRMADVVLRSAGLVPNEPNVAALLAAIERRGWRMWMQTTTMDDGTPNGYRANVFVAGWLGATNDTRHATPAPALARAYCRAVRATEGGGE